VDVIVVVVSVEVVELVVVVSVSLGSTAIPCGSYNPAARKTSTLVPSRFAQRMRRSRRSVQ